MTSEYNARMLLETLGSYVTGTEYDDAGRVTARALGSGLTQEFAYYPWNTQGGRLQQILTKQLPSQNIIQNLGYSYDPVGNITQITNPLANETQNYGYDALDRLTQWRVNGNLSGQYGYNPSSGNLTVKGTTALSYAPVPGNPGTTGLAAWWAMDETAGTRLDSHGTSHLTDNGAVPSAAGVQGKAASFVSTASRYLSAADNPAISTGNIDFTLRAHVYLNSLTGTMIVAMKGEKNDMTKRDFTLFYDGASHFAFRVGNGSTQAAVTSGTVTAGRWYTVTAWHDATQNTLNIQLDNGTVTSVGYSSGAIDTTQPMSVGAFSDGTYILNGKVDELALFKRVLTATERSWLHNDAKGRSYLDLGAQYHAVTSAVTSGTCPQGETCDYDQAQTGVNNTYSYDNNGNQITRTINGVTLTLSYDAEGRMVSVTGQGINATFTYDGDGARVKSIINNTTTYFVGKHYEVSDGVVTKYYYAGSSRVAMKVGADIYYLLSDHLGSTSLTTDKDGDFESELRYSAWGGVRYSWGTTPTDYTFTGQYSNVTDFGLMFYNARWYDPSISHFAQADTIVPASTQGVQAWDRYAYVLNNPSRYTDPTGHRVCDYDCQVQYEGADPAFKHYCETCEWDVVEQRKNEAIANTIIYGGTELAASVLFEPADWAFTAYHCANGDCSPLMLLGLLPFVPSSAGRHGDDVIDLYRAVSKSELDDIFNTRIFRPKPGGGSFDVKEFWLTMKGAKGFAGHYNLPEIVKVTVPRHILEVASETWSNLDQLGPAAGWVDDGLAAFNNAIISIMHVWSK